MSMMLHPLAGVIGRHFVVEGLVQGGASWLQAIRSSRSVSTEDLFDAANGVGAVIPPELLVPDAPTAADPAVVGAAFDGHIIAQLIAFFQSPTGQLIFSVLIKAILAALGL